MERQKGRVAKEGVDRAHCVLLRSKRQNQAVLCSVKS